MTPHVEASASDAASSVALSGNTCPTSVVHPVEFSPTINETYRWVTPPERYELSLVQTQFVLHIWILNLYFSHHNA